MTTSPRIVDTILAKLSEDVSRNLLRLARAETYPNDRYAQQVAASAKEALAALKPIVATYESAYEGWNRYFVVTSSAGGHIHRGMNCSTCLPATTYGWLPELSGCDEGEMIAEYGTAACTVCFPDAPAHPEYKKAEAKDKAEEEAKKNAECPGSRLSPDDWNGRSRYAKCPHCDDVPAITRNGKLRAHKRLRYVEVPCTRSGKKVTKNDWVFDPNSTKSRNGLDTLSCGCGSYPNVIDGVIEAHSREKKKEVRG